MFLITNFKTYKKSLGDHAHDLAELHLKLRKDLGVDLCISPSALDIRKTCKSFPELPVFAQHTDDSEHGSFTGKIPPIVVKEMGAIGTILNHSENRSPKSLLVKSALRAKAVGLQVVMCVESIEEGVELLELCDPDFIAYEPPELIGGDVSVSTAYPEKIKEAVEKIGGKRLIIGAGIKNAEDIKVAKQFGAEGILIASAVVNAKDQEAVLRNLAEGLLS